MYNSGDELVNNTGPTPKSILAVLRERFESDLSHHDGRRNAKRTKKQAHPKDDEMSEMSALFSDVLDKRQQYHTESSLDAVLLRGDEVKDSPEDPGD
eukprot:8549629-Ditylum_brightwellii.AAC.1